MYFNIWYFNTSIVSILKRIFNESNGHMLMLGTYTNMQLTYADKRHEPQPQLF